jgi:hypothetical protein
VTINLNPEQIAEIKEPVVLDITDRLPTAHAELRMKRTVGAIKRIVVHIDDQWRPAEYDAVARYVAQANYHISGRNWNIHPKGKWIPGFGLMYHYKIAGDGQIFRTAAETDVLWHASSWNREGLAICCDCQARQTPTDEQLNALHRLLLWFSYHRPDFPAGRKDVYGHTEEPSTTKSCPAKLLPYVVRFRKGEW